jgi:hypothetical protein
VSLDIVLEPTEKTIVVEKPSRPIPWPGILATGVFTGAAVVTGLIALNAADKYDRLQGEFGTSRADLDAQRAKIRTPAILTDAFIGAALLSALYTTYKLVSWRPEDRRRESAWVAGIALLNGGMAVSAGARY